MNNAHGLLGGMIALLASFAGAGCAGSWYTPGIQRTPVVEADLLSPDSVLVVAGPEYQAGWLHRLFFGDHYRDAWTATVEVERLDLATEAGGLIPYEAGGGFQTKSLKFKGRTGGTFKFRSTEKDPTAVLPYELQRTFAADLSQDHISTSHPAAAIVVDSLAAAAGIPRLSSRLVYLPDDPALGEFRERFGGLLGVFECYPDDGFLGCEKVQNTIKVFRQMDEDSRDRVDAEAFLLARYLDILVGDWDRHVKQWKWLRYRRDGQKVWHPVPLDRDMAFVRLDGVFPWIASMSVTQFSHFDQRIENIYKLTFSGQYLDRRILSGLAWGAWDSIATAFTSRLTDGVIEGAVRRLPAPYLARDGERLSAALKSRRDRFGETARAFYCQLAAFVDVRLSDKREYVRVHRHPDGRVAVTAWLWDKDAGSPIGAPVFSRTFETRTTKEIRVYCGGKDDRVVLEGETEESICVRVVGGTGDDELIDSSAVRGPVLGFLPIRTSHTMTFFYDDAGDNLIVPGPGTCVDTTPFTAPYGGQPQY